MLNFNYHIHSTYSDGRAPLWQMIKQAYDEGLRFIAVTDHGPLPFSNEWSIDQSDRHEYIRTIDEQRRLFPDMTIFRGLELDYIPGTSRDFSELKELWQLDLLLGSVHLVKHPENGKLWFIDGPKENFDRGLDNIFKQDIKAGVKAYFSQINEMIKTQKPEVIGHIDKIRMNNMGRYFSDSDAWYQSLLEETMQLAGNNNCIVEVNTRGFYKGKTEDLFPSDFGLNLIRELQIPVTVNTDAHNLDELKKGHQEAIKRLKRADIKTVKYLSAEGWQDYQL